jgi:hypothetical protein
MNVRSLRPQAKQGASRPPPLFALSENTADYQKYSGDTQQRSPVSQAWCGANLRNAHNNAWLWPLALKGVQFGAIIPGAVLTNELGEAHSGSGALPGCAGELWVHGWAAMSAWQPRAVGVTGRGSTPDRAAPPLSPTPCP